MKLKLFHSVFSIALLIMTFTSPAYGGCISGNCNNGYGTYTDPNGTNYVGEFKDGQTNGHGTMTYADGKKYVGEFKDGKQHGQGIATGPDGTTYVGEYKDGDFNGHGTGTAPDGTNYVGEWKNGEFNGHGTMTYADGKKYVGEYKDGKYNGHGTMTYADGTTWTGEWREDEKYKEIEKRLLKEEGQRQAQAEKKPSLRKEQTPQSGTGSGFFVSKLGHVITNAHVVKGCNRVTVGDNANKQVSAEVVNTDGSNDLALLKLSSLKMASAESKSLIQKLSIVVVPLASKGLLRSEDVRLGEKVLVAGFPFGDVFSNTIKVTSGIVSATRGAGDDSGQFQLDAAVQPGNSGGPIYDSGGNIVGVVISQLDKLKVAKAIGSLPENVNFGIKASTVRQFLISSGLPSKKSERIEEKSTEQLAEIAQNQALMVMCLQ
jgi:V8-like Glu-specific endopeptidase